MAYLLDTNILSEPKQKQPNPIILDWLRQIDDAPSYISVLSLGELEQGIAKLGSIKRATEYREWLENDLKSRFSGRILAVDQEIAQVWGRLTGEALRKGRPLAVVDSLLAATALVYELTLVTRNSKDFVGTEVDLFNPWNP